MTASNLLGSHDASAFELRRDPLIVPIEETIIRPVPRRTLLLGRRLAIEAFNEFRNRPLPPVPQADHGGAAGILVGLLGMARQHLAKNRFSLLLRDLPFDRCGGIK